jgi:hypothetical protein
MRHSVIRLACDLAVVCGVSLRPLALLFPALFLMPLTKSSSKRWMDAMAHICLRQRRGCGSCLPSPLLPSVIWTATTRWAPTTG